MLAHQLFQPIKRVAPGLSSHLRRLGSAILGPAHFAVVTGHARSALAARAVDRQGLPLPWYTYPAVDFFASIDFAGRSVLEFGAGQSTLWWAERAGQVVSIEDDAAWLEQLRARAPAAVELHDDSDLRGAIAGRLFDLVIVDSHGIDRLLCARLALGAAKADGVVVLDNAEGHWGPPGTYPIIDLMREAGFQRVDFYGFAAGSVARCCTSVFFRTGSWLFSGERPPVTLDRYSY